MKQEADSNGLVTDVQWASGNTVFDKKWSERTGYPYS